MTSLNPSVEDLIRIQAPELYKAWANSDYKSYAIVAPSSMADTEIYIVLEFIFNGKEVEKVLRFNLTGGLLWQDDLS